MNRSSGSVSRAVAAAKAREREQLKSFRDKLGTETRRNSICGTRTKNYWSLEEFEGAAKRALILRAVTLASAV
jgi:hypothetical protein